MDRVFLDSNVLFSAAYGTGKLGAGLRRLWDLAETELISSAYAFEEARRNLTAEDQRSRLEDPVRRVQIVPEASASLPVPVTLPEKDAPILRAAIHAGATHLLTGDRIHFGALYGQVVSGVYILQPAEYLRGKIE